MIFLLILFNPLPILAQGMSIDGFCEIYADTAPQRVDKIIRIFKLPQRPVEQLTGKATCQTGETFILKTTCVGLNRVAILTLSHPGSNAFPSGATRLFHLVTGNPSNETLTLCTPPTTE
jgi:hypothetical protein